MLLNVSSTNLELESSTPAVMAACEGLSWMATCRLKCRLSILELEPLICWVVALLCDSCSMLAMPDLT